MVCLDVPVLEDGSRPFPSDRLRGRTDRPYAGRPLHLAYVSADPGVPVFGRKGCSVHAREVMRAFRRRGATIHLLAARLGGAAPPGLLDVAHERLDVGRGLASHERECAAVACNARVAERVSELANLDLVYERHSIWSFGAMEAAHRRGVPSVLEVNAPLIDEQATHRTLEDRVGAERATRRAFEAASTVVAVSPRVADYVVELGGDPSRTLVEANGVDPIRFRASPRRDARDFTVGFVGTLKPWHGLSTLAGGFARLVETHPQARLLIVGDGPGRQSLENRLRELAVIDRVEFTGAVDPDEVPSCLVRMDVGVAPYPKQPSESFYFSPLKLFEYMAAGLPVVASDIGPLAAHVRDGRDGYLTPPGDEAALAGALVSLADRPEVRARMGDAGRGRVITHHTWDALLDRVLVDAIGPS